MDGNNKINFLFFIAVILFIGLIGLYLRLDNSQLISSSTEVIDLTSWNNEKLLRLVGKWRYYPEMLKDDIREKHNIYDNYVELPHNWSSDRKNVETSDGYATYYLSLSGLEQEQTYGIIISDGGLAYRVSINDIDVINNGRVARKEEDYQAQRNFQYGVFTSDKSGEADIYIEVANYDHIRGGFWDVPIIGNIESINNYVRKNSMLEMFFIMSLFAMGLFFLLMYGFARDNKKLFYMSLLCILVALRSLLIGQRLVASFLTWNIQVRLEYLIVFLLLPIIGELTYSFQYVNRLKPIILFYRTFIAAAFGIVIFLPYSIIYQIADYYNYLLIIFFIYLLYQAFIGVFKKIKGARFVFAGYIALVLGGLLEILVARNSFFVMYGSFVMVSFITFMIVSDYASTKRINKYLNEVKEQKEELAHLYNDLNNELDKARSLHESSLPKKQLNCFSLATYYKPAAKLGGDFFDIIRKEDKIVLYISDVTGHDISSNMISIFIKNVINNFILISSDINPRSIIKFLIEQFYAENFPEDYFICIFLVVIDLKTNNISYLGNGFQFPPLVCSVDNDNFKLKNINPPISTTIPKDLYNFNEDSIKLESGLSLIFYTDGIAEQENGGMNYYNRLKKTFYGNYQSNPEQTKQAILDNFKEFNNNSLQGDDDITFIIIKKLIEEF